MMQKHRQLLERQRSELTGTNRKAIRKGKIWPHELPRSIMPIERKITRPWNTSKKSGNNYGL
jgi:hypothetical protein